MKYDLVATATFGLEAVVRREIENLGFKVLKTEDGRVTYTALEDFGLVRAIAKSNLWLRSADRVYLKMGEFDASTFEELYQGIKKIEWENLIPYDGRIVVVGTSVKSTLHSVPACQSIINKAIVDRLINAYRDTNHMSVKQTTIGKSDSETLIDEPDNVLPESGATYKVRFAFLKDHVLVLVDTSGDGLHKRGYRVANVDAPIKETLAAALVQLSFWRAGRILVDPCCGSGTIGIEAALIGMNIAPGLTRKFAAEDWRTDGEWAAVWKEERQAAYAAIDYDVSLDITIGDIDQRAIAAAKENAEEAGVDDQIKFITGDMAALQRFGQKYSEGDNQSSNEYYSEPDAMPTEGIIICNPPYGERIGEKKEIEKVYKSLREFHECNSTWSLFIITSDKDVENKVFGRPADRRRKLYNGMIETTYYQFHGERTDKQKK